ncbi:MAG: COG4315 family predicted lipoprotein [Acidimicrobiales bacterium]
MEGMEHRRWSSAHLSRRRRLAVPMAVLAVTAAACAGTAATTPSASNPTTAPAGSSTSTATVSAIKNPALGMMLVGAKGRTLYLFEKDINGTSHCSGPCAALWPPLRTSGTPHAGSGVSASLLGTTGKTQVTYNGHPLYYYAADTSAGQTYGQGIYQFGARWYAVTPEGTAITTGAAAPSSASS